MAIGIPDYRLLEVSGEARAAAAQMEDRAQEPASARMFDELTRPLLTPSVTRVLEVGCGSGALASRIARELPGATLLATDKSPTMLAAAQELRDAEGVANVTLAGWDVTDDASFPGEGLFDLIISSVMLPYLTDDETGSLVHRLAARLAPGGKLSFVEQDLQTLALATPEWELMWKYKRTIPPAAKKQWNASNLRPLVREAGLDPLPRASFLWIDTAMGRYTRNVLQRTADDMVALGEFTAEEGTRWMKTLDDLAASGDFYYGLVYHRIAGRRPA